MLPGSPDARREIERCRVADFQKGFISRMVKALHEQVTVVFVLNVPGFCGENGFAESAIFARIKFARGLALQIEPDDGGVFFKIAFDGN